jgi:hypothetical protein
LKSLTEKYRDYNPINLDFYYQFCMEARQKGIIFIDPTDLEISDPIFSIQHRVHVASLDLKWFPYNERDIKYFEDISEYEDYEDYVSYNEIIDELGKDYDFSIAQ